jgi:hypothetical protein
MSWLVCIKRECMKLKAEQEYSMSYNMSKCQGLHFSVTYHILKQYEACLRLRRTESAYQRCFFSCLCSQHQHLAANIGIL